MFLPWFICRVFFTTCCRWSATPNPNAMKLFNISASKTTKPKPIHSSQMAKKRLVKWVGGWSGSNNNNNNEKWHVLPFSETNLERSFFRCGGGNLERISYQSSGRIMDKRSLLTSQRLTFWFLGWFEFLTPKNMDSNFTGFQKWIRKFSDFRFENVLFTHFLTPNSEWIFSGSWRLGSSIGQESSGMGFPGRWKNRSQDELWKKSFEPKPPVFLGGLWGTV